MYTESPIMMEEQELGCGLGARLNVHINVHIIEEEGVETLVSRQFEHDGQKIP